jgi:uncharacterized protein (TIRG00374 family)
VDLSVNVDRARRPRSPSSLVLALGAAGLGLLAYVISELGPARIAAELKGLGSVLPAVLLVTGMKYPLQAVGWRLALRREARPPWGESISATITGDALGYLTWAGPFMGEPIRAMLLRASVPISAGIAAGAAERAVYNLIALGVVWAVMLVLLSSAHAWALVSAAAGAGVLVAAAVVALARGGLCERPRAGLQSTRVLSGNPMATTWRVRVSCFFEEIRNLWLTRRRVLPAIAIVALVQHALLVSEAYIMLDALGAAPAIWTALVFEAATKIVNTVGTLVPGRLGVSEGGSALLAGALGFAASHGLSLALMRRMRALIWAAVGLALLPQQEARARRPC